MRKSDATIFLKGIKKCVWFSVKLWKSINGNPRNASASQRSRTRCFKWCWRTTEGQSDQTILKHWISWTFSKVLLVKQFKGLHCQFPESDTEFEVCSWLKFEVHSKVTNAHVLTQKKCNTGPDVHSTSPYGLAKVTACSWPYRAPFIHNRNSLWTFWSRLVYHFFFLNYILPQYWTLRKPLPKG